VVVGPIFKARDEIDKSVTPQKIAEMSSHKNASAFDSFEELFRNLKLEISNFKYEIIVIMGAGKSYLWARQISDLIK